MTDSSSIPHEATGQALPKPEDSKASTNSAEVQPAAAVSAVPASSSIGQDDDEEIAPEADAPIKPTDHESHASLALPANPSARRPSIAEAEYSDIKAHVPTIPPPSDNATEDKILSPTNTEYERKQHLSISEGGLSTKVVLTDHGLDVVLDDNLRSLVGRLQKEFREDAVPVPESLRRGNSDAPTPPLNIVIQIVGSRGDVQPFISLGKVLRENYGHRVRVATHNIFKDFVEENGLEFFNIGGDPAELMAFMVHNPGLIPDVATLRSGEVGKRRRGTHEMLVGCWRSCIEAGDGTGIPIFEVQRDAELDGLPFIADAIIANPPSFAHIHCAEKLGIPLHLMFTMPWSPTKAFPHPLVNMNSTSNDSAATEQANFISYALVEMMTWQGLGDVINKFRKDILSLEPVSLMWAPGMNSRLRIPFTYCWSPALIPMPKDWGPHISISGFFFLNLQSSYTPVKDLLDFLAAGPPPVYIGFGSIVVDDPNSMTDMIFSAVKKLGIRALVSKGWGGLGGDALKVPENIFMLGNVPHDFLFQHVSAVVHHGGAGTTAAGIAAGRPTVVVPFFGDQPFWGNMIARAGAGPKPIPFKQLNVDNLVTQLEFALKPETLVRAKELGQKMALEEGNVEGAKLFHGQLGDEVRCSILPDKSAVWRIKRTDVKLSTLAATVLINRGLVDLKDLKLHRPREYQLEDGPWEPVSGVTSALVGTLGSLAMGIADLPTEFYHSLKSEINTLHSNRSKGSISRESSVSSVSPTQYGKDEQYTRPAHPRDASIVSLQSPTTAKDDKVETKNEPNHNSVQQENQIAVPLSEIPTETEPAKVMSPMEKIRFDKLAAVSQSVFAAMSSGGMLDRNNPDSSISAAQILSARPSGHSRTTAHAVEFLIRGPLDLISGLSGGFHNAPRLYGDTTVRQPSQISGMQSGLSAAGKDFALGIIDGVSGLVTQPYQGAKEHGVAGALSGVVKGVGGLILKPVSAITSVPADLLKGAYKELEKKDDFCLQTHIVLSRIAIGLDEVRVLQGPDFENLEVGIIKEWRKVMQLADAKAQDRTCIVTGKTVRSKHGLTFKKARHMTHNEAAINTAEKKQKAKSSATVGTSAAGVEDENLMEGVRTERGSVDGSIFSLDSEEGDAPKMDVKLMSGKMVKKHMTIKEVVNRLKGEHHLNSHEHHHFFGHKSKDTGK